MAEVSPLPFEYMVFSLTKHQDGEIVMDLHHYLQKLGCILRGASLEQSRFMRMKVPSLPQSRPDCLCEIGKLAQSTREMFKKKLAQYIRRLNMAIKYATDNPNTLKFCKFNANR